MANGASLSRRRFLGVTAASAVACGALTPERAAADTRRCVNERVRIGVVGCGRRGVQLIEALSKRSGVQVTCVSDVFSPRLEYASSRFGCAAVPRWQDLVSRHDLDAIVVATPDHWHAPIAIAAMESGKDVYCETPMALSLDEAKAFRDCAVRTQRIVQIGAEQASEDQWHAAAAIVRSGRIGRLRWSQGDYRVRSTPAGGKPAWPAATPETLDWHAFHRGERACSFAPDRFDRWWAYFDYSGGIATAAFYPKLAALLLAAGSEFPVRVSAAGGVYARDGREVPDSLVMTCEYPGGHTVVLASAMARGEERPAIIRGERGSIEFLGGAVRVTPEPAAGCWLRSRLGAKSETVPARERLDHLGDWIEGVRERRPCVCNEELGYRAMVPIAMALEAYRSNRTLYFDPATGSFAPGAPPQMSA